MLGAKRSPYLRPGEWQLQLGVRNQRSHRHFVGTEEQEQRRAAQSEVINDIMLYDLSATLGVNNQTNVTLSIPFLQAGRISGRLAPRLRNVVHASGVGDISVTGRWWVVPTRRNPKQNLSVGLGMKFPTGDPGVQDTTIAGGVPVVRTVDQSIQPGDGGLGFILDLQAFKLVGNTTLFASGTYLANPENTNGVRTFRNRASEAIMSVADQYQIRMGAVFPMSRVPGLAFSLGARAEGVPVTDIIGRSDGFRRPGYAVSFEPGFILSRGNSVVTLSIPVAVHRERQTSVTDRIDSVHGDAAFADYFILLGYSYRFGGGHSAVKPTAGQTNGRRTKATKPKQPVSTEAPTEAPHLDSR